MKNDVKLPAIAGKQMIIQAPFRLPAICVVTGRTDELIERRQEFTVHSGLSEVAGILGPGFHVAVDLLTRRKVLLEYFISRRALQAERQWMTFGWFAIVVFFGALAAGILSPFVWMITIVAPISAISAGLVYYTKVRGVYVERANDQYALIRGIPLYVMRGMVPAPQNERA